MERRVAQRIACALADFDRLGVGRQVGFERLHLYSIITHSTAIEGSTITVEENTVMFDDGVLPSGRQVHEQMMNLDLKRAYEFAEEIARERTPLSMPLLKALAALVMKNTGSFYNTINGSYDEARGDLRLQNVSAGRGGRSYLGWEKVEIRTSELLDWLNARLVRIDDMPLPDRYDLSFETHFRLVTIHPWSDGNGRMARLLMNLVQLEGGLVPTYVRDESKPAYIASLGESQDKGSSNAFLAFMAQESLDILTEMVEDYMESMLGDVPWAGGREKKDDIALTPQVAPQVTPQVAALLEALGLEELGSRELRLRLALSDSKNFRERYLAPSIEMGFVEMTLPDKPRSSKQRYRLTQAGRDCLARRDK